MFVRLISLILLLNYVESSLSFAAGKARHVVVLVWDGMRPDFVSEELTPTLFRLAREGVTFQNHHPVYLSATEVNGTALATGAYPSHSGVMANREFRPAIDPLKPFNTEALAAVRHGDELTHGHYLERLTVAEILQRSGRRTAIAGTKPVALLHDRAARRDDTALGLALFEGQTLPTSILGRITNALGSFPSTNETKIKRDLWTTQALLGSIWNGPVPAYSLLWLAEPDFSQHETGPGSSNSLAAIRSSDRNLALVLRALEDKGVREQTDVFVVSDHGFSTISRKVDVAADLKKAGFNAEREFKTAPATNALVVASNGGAVALYVIGRNERLIDRLVRFLQQQDYVGVIFTRRPAPGAFTLEQARLHTINPPDMVFSLQWSADKSTNGVPGLVISDDPNRKPGQGMHVTLSRFDMHNILFASGPDFRRGVVDPLPTGNTDIAPTVLWILGVRPPKTLDGRVLTEALNIPGPKIKSFETSRLEAKREHEHFVWHQYLNVTQLNGVVYFDEGNSFTTLK